MSARDISRRGQRLVEAPGDNEHPSTALAWWIGAMAARVAALRLDERLRWDVEQVRAAVARSKRCERIAIVMTGS